MKIDSFDRFYIHELKDVYNAEKQLVQALPKMAQAASHTELEQVFTEHLEETKNHVQRLERIFENLEMSPGGEKCQAMEGIIEEAEEILGDSAIPDDVKDAALIAGAQRAEHYEIAVYGTLCNYAELLGRDDDAMILKETLQEEKMADEKLNMIATGGINREAMEGQDGQATGRGHRGGSPPVQ